MTTKIVGDPFNILAESGTEMTPQGEFNSQAVGLDSWVQSAVKSILGGTLFLNRQHDFLLVFSNSFLHPFLKSKSTKKNSLWPKKFHFRRPIFNNHHIFKPRQPGSLNKSLNVFRFYVLENNGLGWFIFNIKLMEAIPNFVVAPLFIKIGSSLLLIVSKALKEKWYITKINGGCLWVKIDSKFTQNMTQNWL